MLGSDEYNRTPSADSSSVTGSTCYGYGFVEMRARVSASPGSWTVVRPVGTRDWVFQPPTLSNHQKPLVFFFFAFLFPSEKDSAHV